ncbi:hypothetical protein [Pedobacter glucosidilyticus]|uniref:hypothetical protein n=1 Tax=Pedobacter glucosidilyticus TaxID=1122941 RepID=UPI00042A50B1|nr:hypothetical protein [Pedobacter glucosidilyticus]
MSLVFKAIKFYDFFPEKSTALIFGNLALTSLNFLTVVVLSNELNINIYGQIREIMLYASFIFLFCSAGFSQTLYYFLNKTDNILEVLRITGTLRFLTFIFSLFVFSITAVYLFNFSTSLTLYELILLAIYLVPLILSSIDLNLNYYHKREKQFFLANIVVITLKLILLSYFTKYEFSIINFLLILAVTQWLSVFYSIYLLKERYFGIFILGSDFSLLKKQIIYAYPITFSAIIGFLVLNTDKIIVSFSSITKDKLAILSNISFEAPIISTIYLSFFTISLPYMIKAFDKGDFEQVLSERFDYIFKVAKIILPVVVSFIVWSNDYMVLIFGATYKEYGGLFAIFSTISLLRFCSHHDIFLATNNTSYILFYQIIELVFQVILSISLYYFFDLLGLIIASVITNYGYMFFVNLKSSKILKVKFKDILPFAFLIKRMVTLSISAIIVKYVFENIFTNIFWMIPLIIWLLIIAFVEFRILKGQNSQ